MHKNRIITLYDILFNITETMMFSDQYSFISFEYCSQLFKCLESTRKQYSRIKKEKYRESYILKIERAPMRSSFNMYVPSGLQTYTQSKWLNTE